MNDPQQSVDTFMVGLACFMIACAFGGMGAVARSERANKKLEWFLWGMCILFGAPVLMKLWIALVMG